MCTELREQPALSVARVEVNYFQRRLPGASIKARLPFLPSFSCTLFLCLSLSVSLSLCLSHTIHTHTYWRKRTCTRYRTPSHVDPDSLLTVSHPVPVAAIPRRACRRGPFTNAHDYRGFVGKAPGLRASWESPGIVAFRMKQCATGRWSRMGKFDPARALRARTEPNRAAGNFAFGLTIMRHVPRRFINAPAGTTRNYEWTVENNRPRRTKRSMRTVDPRLSIA